MADTPEHLSSTHREACTYPHCPEAVKRDPATGRFYVTMWHPGFNSEANNGAGYATPALARAAFRHYASQRPRPVDASGLNEVAVASLRSALDRAERAGVRTYGVGDVVDLAIGSDRMLLKVETVGLEDGRPGGSGTVVRVLEKHPRSALAVGDAKWFHDDQVVRVVRGPY